MRIVLFFFYIIVIVDLAFGVPENLLKVKNEIEVNEKNLEKLLKEKELLESELVTVQERVQIISDKKKALALKLNELNKEIEEANYYLKILEKKQIKLKNANRKRVVRAYKQWKLGRQNEIPKVLNTNLTYDKKAYYYKRIQKLDRSILSGFIQNEVELIDKKDGLLKLLKDQDLIEANLLKEKKDLNNTLKESKKLLKQLNSKSKLYENELIDLRGKALRFEIALKALIDKSSANSNNIRSNRGLTDRDKIDSDKNSKLQGLNSKYLFPVDVEVTLKRDYGKKKVKNLNDYVHNKGVSVLLSSDCDVKAISDGIVVFVGKMPAYEKVIIVHHGGRDYSLYAKLDDIEVNKGDEVSKGEIIATDIDDTEFYFEIRINNKHVNPKKFIANWNNVVL